MSNRLQDARAPAPFANRLLAALGDEDRERLAGQLQRVPLDSQHVPRDAGGIGRYVYFPESGLASILETTAAGESVGIATVGNEGVLGWPAVVDGRPRPPQVIIHLTGTAIRLGTEVVRDEFQRSRTLQDLLLRYTNCYIAQISRSVACQRFHTVPQRLARWLLVVQDRASTSSLGLTHAGIARVLGIPRTGVTAAAGELKEAGVIWYRHGRVEIRSRRRLEREACECYGVEAAWLSAARAPEAVTRPHRS